MSFYQVEIKIKQIKKKQAQCLYSSLGVFGK